MRTLAYITAFNALAWVRVGLVIWCVAILATGCSGLVPSERARSESVRATESLAVEQERTIRRMLEVSPQTAAAPNGQAVKAAPTTAPLREELSYTTSTRTGAGSASVATGQQATTIPAGVKLLLLAAGVAALTGAALLAWRHLKSTAVGQAVGLADDVLAAKIRTLRNEAAASTDTQTIAKAQTQVAELEAERGRLRAKLGAR